MRRPEIEGWARSVVERVQGGNRVEDANVELKAGVSEHQKLARRLAGQANAARGEPILWLLGVDEDNGVVGVGDLELSNWMSQVMSWFDAGMPAAHDAAFDVDGKTVIAIQFDTDNPPFVVRTGNTGGIEFEVPWREGTRIRSARRSELLKILLPLSESPLLEVLGARFEMRAPSGQIYSTPQQFRLRSEVNVYVTPRGPHTVFPLHRASLHFQIESEGLEYSVPIVQIKSRSATLIESDTEIVAEGPGMMTVVADIPQLGSGPKSHEPGRLILTFGVAGEDRPVTITHLLKPHPASTAAHLCWGDFRA